MTSSTTYPPSDEKEAKPAPNRKLKLPVETHQSLDENGKESIGPNQTRKHNNRKSRLVDLTGMKFGRLTVLSNDGFDIQPNGDRRHKWLCLCDCGNQKSIRGSLMKNGTTASCGCFRKEATRLRLTKHGASAGGHTPEYRAWAGVIQRTTNPKNTYYSDYGGRGIKVCDRWRSSFQNFLDDMGHKPSKGHSIDRIDVNGNYEPDNCRWVTNEVQANNKRNNFNIEFQGEMKTVTQWAEIIGINRMALKYRLKNWTLEKALSKQKYNRNGHAIN